MAAPAVEKGVRVAPRLVALFTRQLSAMLESGVPLLRGLDTLSEQPENPDFAEVVGRCAELVAAGHPFSHACSLFPAVFPPLYLTMLRVGERIGQLDGVLERLAGWMERDESLRRRVRSALNYPLLVLGISVLLTLGLFYTVLPGFLQMFREMEVPLPWITRVVMAVTDAVRSPAAWLTAAGALGLLVALTQHAWSNGRRRAAIFERLGRIPVIGRLLWAGTVARYCAAAAILLESGVELIRVFRLAARASGNPILEQDSEALCASIREGKTLSEHMAESSHIYPETLLQMVVAGEESSRLGDLLGRAAGCYEEETNFLVDSLGPVLEPALLMGVASVIGTVLIAIFLPMYSLIGKIG